MKTSDFYYQLPPELIAQTPLEPRDHSRLMVLDRTRGNIGHQTRFHELTQFLRKGDVLVFNNSQVIPARLFGRKYDTGGKVEFLLLRRLSDGNWESLVKPAARIRPGSRIIIDDSRSDANLEGLEAMITGSGETGLRYVKFSDESLLKRAGEIPLPPYIQEPLRDSQRYQTVYSEIEGSVAAPTAGLHFTRPLLEAIEKQGVECLYVTLHVGLDTFRPVREEDPREHVIHQEYGTINGGTAKAINEAKQAGRRIVSVGTTTLRILEAAASANDNGYLEPFEQQMIDIYILPGYRFKLVDALITNFHLPCSTLLMLVSAFTGREVIAQAYQEAIRQQYRFYSFGDAMLIV